MEQEAIIIIEGHKGETSIFNVGYSGNKDLVKYLIEQGADINKKSSNSETPLTCVYQNKDDNLISYLIEFEVSK